MEAKFNLWDFLKLMAQVVAVIAFLITLQSNLQHMNKELDAIRNEVAKIDEVRERVIILETKINYKNEYLFSGANNRENINSK